MPDLQGQLTAALQEHYAIQREVGHGGMAVVYLARDLKHDRDVAIKILHPHLAEALGRQRFLREIRVAAKLRHPNLLPLYDSGDADGSLYYVVPYVAGGSLRDRLDRELRLEPAPALQLAREAAEALDYAHRNNVIHRDIKPENILLDEGHAVIADFGVARAISEAVGTHLTDTGLLLGTPAYMSPEQVNDDPVDGRSDIYGLACVLFELLTGAPPFAARSPVAALARRLSEPAPRLHDCGMAATERLEELMARALARLPEDRFSSAGEFADNLAALGRESSPTQLVNGPAWTHAANWSLTPPERHAVAVLPFVNLSAERENDYFTDGMADELINALAQVKGLRVAARTSCFSFRGKDLDAQTIARRLKVNSLVEGSIRQVGTRIRLTAQLVDEDGYQRWSQTYERTMSDVFALQEELAQAIARELPIVVSATEDLRLVKPASQNVEAYTLYMRGRYFANKRTIDGLRAATGYYEQAIALDPSAAPAHCGLAACMSLRGFEEFGDLPPRESMPKAKAAALRALEIDPASTEAHLWRAVVLMLYDWDRSAAEAEFELATESGQNPIAHLWHAVFLGIGGRFEESIAVVQRALALDPLSLPVHQTVARCYAWAEEYDKALEQLQVTRQMDPHHPLTYVWLSRVYLGEGRLEEALAEAQRGMEAGGRAPLLLQLAGCAYGRLGREAEARGVLNELRELSQHQYVSPMFEGYVLGAMGEFDAAFRTFEGALEQRCGLLAFLHVTHETGGYGGKNASLALSPALRSDPRFAALLKRVHSGI